MSLNQLALCELSRAPVPGSFFLITFAAYSPADEVFQESAYVYALSLAVITHTVVKGCSQNVIANCSCTGDSDSPTVCPSSVEYGLQTAEDFLHKRYTSVGGGIKQQIAHHNFVATKQVSAPTFLLLLCLRVLASH